MNEVNAYVESLPDLSEYPLNTWVAVAERNRDAQPLLWTTYDTSPVLVHELTDLAKQGHLLLMHKHEPDKVIAMIYIPAKPVSLF